MELLKKLGLLPRESRPASAPNPDSWVLSYQFKTFIDIGAHRGEFIDHWLSFFPDLNILAFEPLPDFAARLKTLYSNNSRIKVYDFALGKTAIDQVPLLVSSYAPSSSLLEMGELHKSEFPHTAGSTTTSVKVRRLDDVLRNMNLEFPLLIKIDTQGYEDRVIDGGEITLKSAQLVLIEVSFATLYKDQELFEGTYARLKALGFKFMGMRNQILSPTDGRPLQAHAWFERVVT